MDRKKHSRVVIMTILLLTIILLLATGVFGHYLATGLAIIHMSSVSDGDNYHYVMTEYSAAHDAYFVHFVSDENHMRRLGLYHRYLPVHVFFDSDYPG